MRTVENIKIGISGVRGIIGETLSPEIVLNFTQAFSTLIGKGKVAVAKDSRVSGEFIERAVFSGLIFSGITPVYAFTIPTPTLQIFVKTKKLSGGIIITASHNPEQWNGLKFIDKDGLFLSSYNASHLLDVYHQRSFIIPKENQFPSVVEAKNAFNIHKEKIYSIVNRNLIKRKKFKVLVDPGGGASSLYDKSFLEGLGCKVKIINNEIGIYFPRDPDCSPENLKETADIIKKGDFDIGFSQDSDADRLAIIDEDGSIVSGDYVLAIALSGFLEGKDPGKIVTNLSTSRVIDHVAEEHGFSVERTHVGEINVVEKMIETSALAGGEGNGGVIIPDVHYCRDSFVAMALVLETMAKTGKKVSEIIKTFPLRKMIKTKIPFSMTEASRIVSLLRDEYPKGNTMDGLKVDGKDYWFHIRASNTEPILRIVAEGQEGKIDKIVNDIKKKITDLKTF